jgi:hypothetical protein
MSKKMPVINECEMTTCAYNQQRVCHAMAITVGDTVCPMCDTFFARPDKGGVGDMTGTVGACKESDCQFNDALECSAPGIKVASHGGHPDCSTYKRR